MCFEMFFCDVDVGVEGSGKGNVLEDLLVEMSGEELDTQFVSFDFW